MRIGLFLKNMDEEYQISIYKGVKMETEALDMDLICIQGEMLHEALNSAGESFPSGNFISADGFLFLSSVLFNRSDMDLVADLKTLLKSIPLVSIGTRLFGYPSIITESRKSMEDLMNHLIVFHGYRKLLYIGGPKNHPDNIEREQVFRDSIETMRNSFSGLEGRIINGEFLEMSGMVIMRDYIAALPDNPPDVIVAANDNMAIGIRSLLVTQRNPRWVNCPITGFDDISQAKLEVPALTTIRQPMDVLGRLAVRTLRDIIMERQVPMVIYTESNLIIRASCGCEDYPDAGKDQRAGDNRPLNVQYYSILFEYHLRNVSLLGQRLVAVNNLEDMFSNIQFFLQNLGMFSFYLIVYPEPARYIPDTGDLVYQYTLQKTLPRKKKYRGMKIKELFTGIILRDHPRPRSWCLSHLRSGREYLGFIVYEAPDAVHPQLCSAAIFIANTIKRLLIYDDEKERARKLEQEVAFRTKDLLEANAKLQEEAKRRIGVEAEVLRISEMERLRFSLDLHDDICQRLAGISMYCKSLAGGSGKNLPLSELSDLIDETLQQTRRYAHDSFPMELDTLGLKDALGSLCRMLNTQTSCRCIYTWSAPEPSPLNAAQDINVYRIIQEALQNTAKHSKASCVTVDIRTEPGVLIVSVRDNGTGTPQLEAEIPLLTGNRRREGLGLRSMRYRAHQLGAEYIFKSNEIDGTLIEVRIPLL